ncbi:hypothetical protein BT96DRAFT_277575 [Gymnopus androsaceus JB14]|uniref:F-box domain-containing protein n=1 Tax=Gymnopus androsaceus JB14 TaxID=1447944 RepID=A0A6A4H3I3_9AGAR|nr:hypothetical protein BT96DRAFT_277575 [Gymnopus androsaceus JB14]
MQEYNTILVPHFLKLNAVLLESPHLASYVQSLVLQFGNATITEALNDVTASIVQQLSNVNSLSLSFVFWDRFSLPLQVALKDIFRAPSLTRVTLYEFSIPTFHELASLLSHATHLKALCVQVDCGYDMPRSAIDAIGATSFPPRSIQLDRLQFGQSFATYISSWLGFRRSLLIRGSKSSITPNSEQSGI